MGQTRFDANQWANYQRTHVTGKSQAQVFTATSINKDLDPTKFAFRESCDSAANPNATGVTIATDVTGSMGFVAHELIKEDIKVVATEIYDRKPIPDPHIMVMAIGDAKTDRSPIQMTQYESGATELATQLSMVHVEGNGGGNGGESYCLAHLGVALKTRLACVPRGQKGYLFTVGDEPVHNGVTREEAKRFLGVVLERDLTAAECVALAEKTHNVFHIVLRNEGYAATGLDRVLETWKPLLPERTILLDDYHALAETIVSLIQVTQGANHAAVAASWSGNKSVVVANAIKGIAAVRGAGKGVRRLTA